MTGSGGPVSKTWSVQIDLGEHDGMTRAVAGSTPATARR